MANNIRIISHQKNIETTIHLGGSKSISNRALLIRALCPVHFDIINCSDSDDSKTMIQLLQQQDGAFDAGHAGTTFRFLTAYFAFRVGSQLLTGSQRMQQRPIGVLVDALNSVGANIEYVGVQGYPPLMIHAPSTELKNVVTLKADVSSQFISALLMLAPTLPRGLTIHLEGDLVSKPYLMMTLSMMQYFGVSHQWENNSISISPQEYQGKQYFVEADWSSASYIFSWAAASDRANIQVEGLMKDSLQGDSAIVEIARSFGVETLFGEDHTLTISKNEHQLVPIIEHDFIMHPDIAQTVFGMCAATGVKGLFTGLQTLYIKETDRIKAFQIELAKIGFSLAKIPARFSKKDEREFFLLEGIFKDEKEIDFDTYHDHRMAMALAPLSMHRSIIINDADVVSKSYPNYWNDVITMGLTIENI